MVITASLLVVLAQSPIHEPALSVAYDPAGRRDPFQAQPLMAATDVPDCSGRAECHRIADLQLHGTIRTAHGLVALLDASGHSYLLRPGQAVYDGEVLAISDTTVTFRHNVSDPLAIKPFEIVVKSLSLRAK